MTKRLFFLTALLLFCLSTFAQNNLQLNIHHKLGEADFTANTGAKNNIDHDFNVKRLQYYISEISIIHDGGTETSIDDLYILVDAKFATEVDLGDYDINLVEGVNFYIGVDDEHNHLDPSSYQSSHPLAPQLPSMHWGWSAGYRFLAYEGFGSSSFNQLFELHGLGDDNYFKTEIPLTAIAENNEIVIDIDADYARGLEDIALNSGVIVHGEYGAAKVALQNFRDYVFSATNTPTSVVDFSEISQFDVFPNPVIDGSVTIIIAATQDLTYEVLVTDVVGRKVTYFDAVNSNSSLELNLNQQGMYFVNLIKDGQPVITKKLIAQ